MASQTISFSSTGSFANTERFLKRIVSGEIYRVLNNYGSIGTRGLAAATPSESGETAASWYHEIEITPTSASISWKNRHMAGAVPVVVLIQFGHGTGTGGYVPGRDFINPIMRPLFDQIANEVWKQVTSA